MPRRLYWCWSAACKSCGRCARSKPWNSRSSAEVASAASTAGATPPTRCGVTPGPRSVMPEVRRSRACSRPAVATPHRGTGCMATASWWCSRGDHAEVLVRITPSRAAGSPCWTAAPSPCRPLPGATRAERRHPAQRRGSTPQTWRSSARSPRSPRPPPRAAPRRVSWTWSAGRPPGSAPRRARATRTLPEDRCRWPQRRHRGPEGSPATPQHRSRQPRARRGRRSLP
mmetsp:Transcript_79469/g.224965  ORF Transcript_79469/g.224965 Transcript_79469/m.224965 type:complete len:228 (+) Transcript_79469:319-1002(+)